MADKAPAFQWYAKDFLTDEKVVLMSNTETGIYIRLLSFCWLEGTLPLETDKLARFARMPVKQFTKLWEHSVVRTCFHVGEDGRLHHKRLDEERGKQQTYRDGQSESGKRGAAARWGGDERRQTNRRQAHSEPIAQSDGVAINSPMAKNSSSSATASAVSNLQTAVKEVAPSAASKRPIYQSDRFVVFEWQLSELEKTLGPHFENFRLDEFFDRLSQQSREAGLVIPSDREARWTWLQAQVEAEAKRRGLPVADVVSGPTNKRIDNLMRGGQKFLERAQ